MSRTFTRGRIISTFTLLAVLVSMAGGHAATAAATTPATTPSAERSLSASANAGYVAFSANSPTLTSDIGQPSNVAARQLPIGIGLLTVGLLGLLYALVALLLARRRTIAHAT